MNNELNNNENTFKYIYTAPTKSETKIVEDIRKKYIEVEKQDNDVDRLKHLDKKVNNIPTIISLVLGVVGTLIFGLGMSMVLEFDLIIWGVVVSFFGAIILGFAYPVYKIFYNKLKNKYRDEILELSNKILNNENKD